MSYFVLKKVAADGEKVRRGPFSTENEARMVLANEVEEAFASDSSLARRDVQAEVDEAVRFGAKEITDATGTVVFSFSIEQE